MVPEKEIQSKRASVQVWFSATLRITYKMNRAADEIEVKVDD